MSKDPGNRIFPEKKTAGPEGHRQRLRKRFADQGIGALQDYERMEMFLMYAVPRKDVKPLAKTLMNHFGSFSAVVNAPAQVLKRFVGLGDGVLLLLRIFRDLQAWVMENEMSFLKYSTPLLMEEMLRSKIGHCGGEKFLILYLDVFAHIIDSCMFDGGERTLIKNYRKIMENCLCIGGTRMVAVHYYPEELPELPGKDASCAEKICLEARKMDIEIQSYLVLTPGNIYNVFENIQNDPQEDDVFKDFDL